MIPNRINDLKPRANVALHCYCSHCKPKEEKNTYPITLQEKISGLSCLISLVTYSSGKLTEGRKAQLKLTDVYAIPKNVKWWNGKYISVNVGRI